MPLVVALGCVRQEMAYVKVSDARQVAVMAEAPPADEADEALPASAFAGTYRASTRWGDRIMERRDDGAIVQPPQAGGGPDTLVGADGSITPFPATLLPTGRSETFITKQRWSVGGRFDPCDFFCAFTLSTPWSNVEHVTIRNETSVPRALVVLGLGTIATLLGGLVLRDAHETGTQRAFWTASGVGIGALGLTLDVVAIVGLLTPDEERTWVPPK